VDHADLAVTGTVLAELNAAVTTEAFAVPDRKNRPETRTETALKIVFMTARWVI
jgi:hypothetical protein